MPRLDRNDPIDRMLIQALNGEPLLFDQVLEFMDDLAEEPDCAEILQEKGLRREDVLGEAKAYRADLRARLSARGLPVDDRFTLCRLLSEQAKAEPSAELLRIYAEILCDRGLLLDKAPPIKSEEDRLDYEDQMILQYLRRQEELDQVLHILTQRGELAGKLAEVTKQNRSPRPVDCDTSKKDEIAHCFLALYEIPKRGRGEILLDNLANYIQIAAASPALKSIEPLFLFRLLTLRKSYMCSQVNLNAGIAALWKRDDYKVDQDNGKNFKKYRKELQLFSDICELYQKDPAVDLPLCWYGLDRLTVLCEFYRNEVEDIWDYTDSPPSPIPPTIDEIINDILFPFYFTCFDNGVDDNLLLTESGLPYSDLEDFQLFSEHPMTVKALERISDYIQDHGALLAEQFHQAGPEDVKALCRSILEKAKIKRSVSEKNLPLYLAAINNELMTLLDELAKQHLIEAGYALTDMPLTKTPGSSG